MIIQNSQVLFPGQPRRGGDGAGRRLQLAARWRHRRQVEGRGGRRRLRLLLLELGNRDHHPRLEVAHEAAEALARARVEREREEPADTCLGRLKQKFKKTKLKYKVSDETLEELNKRLDGRAQMIMKLQQAKLKLVLSKGLDGKKMYLKVSADQDRYPTSKVAICLGMPHRPRPPAMETSLSTQMSVIDSAGRKPWRTTTAASSSW